MARALLCGANIESYRCFRDSRDLSSSSIDTLKKDLFIEAFRQLFREPRPIGQINPTRYVKKELEDIKNNHIKRITGYLETLERDLGRLEKINPELLKEWSEEGSLWLHPSLHGYNSPEEAKTSISNILNCLENLEL